MSVSPASVLLIASLPSLEPPLSLVPAIVAATRAARENLTILLYSPLFNSSGGINHSQSFDQVQRLLTFVYVQATKVSQELNKILLNIDVLLKGLDNDYQFLKDFDTLFRITEEHIDIPIPSRVLSLPQTYINRSEDDSVSSEPHTHPDELSPSNVDTPSTYPVVALGGTFDHLHPGHKILLSMALFITSRKIIVGVTHSSLLRNKINADFLESLETRIANVRQFSELFWPGLESYDVVPIEDVYGPTGWDTDIQALVVSKETLKGAEAIASHRASKSLPPLKTFIIDVISHDSVNLDDSDQDWLRNAKMSSTFIRGWIARQKA
ncbi:pantetheine-phosphate adenylyltransferase [Moniliophthora roreri MCA 2997]|uniref:Pantetheine-phosphate adenylyltransferase n=2 Tax=Moniliophthora roreri TaxID=221103 RepID=V2X7W5_MONRO|nr:pantetheine-phosphate adenylyltransferase [Moniliophthora roreri MCA 2997]KAI3599986.1 pantetheine-phosphate adenylyltransferase [Moniliophthora roreri]